MSTEPNTEDERTGARVGFRVELAAREAQVLVTAAQLEAVTALLLEGSGGKKNEREAQQVHG